MSIIDGLFYKAKSTGETVGKKANELLEQTKLNLSISGVQSEIDKTFREIGQIVFDLYKNGEVFPSEISTKCADVDEKYEKIDELRSDINRIKNIKVCAQCTQISSASNDFCPKCGAKLPDREKDTGEDEK